LRSMSGTVPNLSEGGPRSSSVIGARLVRKGG